MKKIYFLVAVLCCIGFASAQIVNIPDANFKAKLLTASDGITIPVASTSFANQGFPSTYNKIDTNNDGEIQVSEALLIKSLDISNSNISDLTGLSYFSNLNTFFCHSNQISNLSEVNSMPWLVQIQMNYNTGLTEINLSNLINLKRLTSIACGLTVVNVANNVKLETLELQVNLITTLDVSNCPNLRWLKTFNNRISYLNMKNGNINSWISLFIQNGEQYLNYICVDQDDLALVQSQMTNVPSCQVNTYCNFTPGGTYYTIQGEQRLDYTNNGCDVNDILIPNLKYLLFNGTNTTTIISNNSGSYSIPVQAGAYTITPVLDNPNYFSVNPPSISVNFPLQTSPVIQNFCITNLDKHDVETIIIPINLARPGFDAMYRILFRNKGNRIENGVVSLQYNDAFLDLVSAQPSATTQTPNNLSWAYANLQPFEIRDIGLVLNVNSPMEIPAVNDGDILNYVVNINSIAADETPNDNTFIYNQTVVNSLDPNDKTCLEGATISQAKVGEYVHYMIRFENNGTANAQNIVVKDMIDLAKFDINSLIPIKGSHSFVTNISAGNKVEFIFENINLPFDNANNDGYVAFKIKTKSTLVNGNTFSNTASIYFDYNFPIITNTATTTIQTLANEDFDFASYFTIYPNPVKDVLKTNHIVYIFAHFCLRNCCAF